MTSVVMSYSTDRKGKRNSLSWSMLQKLADQKLAGNHCDPPSCYWCLLSLCIMQCPSLMAHSWLQWFLLESTKIPRILNITCSSTELMWWKGNVWGFYPEPVHLLRGLTRTKLWGLTKNYFIYQGFQIEPNQGGFKIVIEYIPHWSFPHYSVGAKGTSCSSLGLHKAS